MYRAYLISLFRTKLLIRYLDTHTVICTYKSTYLSIPICPSCSNFINYCVVRCVSQLSINVGFIDNSVTDGFSM